MSRLFLALGFLVLFSATLSSRHLIGGHFEYVCLSSNDTGSYLRLKMVLIRDVSGGGAEFDIDAWVGVYEKHNDGSYSYFTTIANIAPVFIEDLDLSTYLPFTHFTTQVFQKGVYEMEVRLPKGKDYTLSYQRCCFTDDVTSILNSGENGLALTMDIHAEALDLCDNSPVLPSLPFLLAPIGVEINHDIQAFDPESNAIDMALARFPVSGGLDGVSSGNPLSCTGVRPSSEGCPPPYGSAQYLLPTYSELDPFGDNDLHFFNDSKSFIGLATVSGRFAYNIETVQSVNGQVLSSQNVQYIPTFVLGLDVGRMIANPFVDLNSNGLRESEEPSFFGIQLDVDNAISNQVMEDGTIIVKLEPGQYDVKSHLPKGWKMQSNQSMPVSIDLSGRDYEVDIPIVHESSDPSFSAHASLSQGLCNDPGLVLLTIRNESSSAHDILIEMDNKGLFSMMNHPDGLYTIEGDKLQADISDLSPSSWISLPIYVNNPSLNQDTSVNVIIATESSNDTLQVFLQRVCGNSNSSLTSTIESVKSIDERVLLNLAFRNDNPGDVFLVRSKIKLNENIDFNSFRIESSTQPVSIILNENNRTVEVVMHGRGIPSSSSGNHHSGGMINYSVLPILDIRDGNIIEVEAEVFMDNHTPIISDPLNISVDLQNVSTTDLAYDIRLYPNPFTSEIWIRGIPETGRMMIYDVHGKVLINTQITEEQRLPLDHLIPGLYFYRYSTQSGEASGRLIKHE